MIERMKTVSPYVSSRKCLFPCPSVGRWVLASALLAFSATIFSEPPKASDMSEPEMTPKATVVQEPNQVAPIATLPVTQPSAAARPVGDVLRQAVFELRRRIEAGPPFLMDERMARIQRLEQLLAKDSADLAETFRLILEAYRVELGFGKTVQAFRGTLQQSEGHLVNFLSVGRLALYYQTLDGRSSAVWLNGERRWQPLSSEANERITDGLRVARQEVPPGLMYLPLETPP